jgi:hypothetical protein
MDSEVIIERLKEEKVTTEKLPKEGVMKSDALVGYLSFSAGSTACR